MSDKNADYTPPEVWSPPAGDAGRRSSINRPTAGARHEALERLIGRPALRLQLGAAARARVTGDFSADAGIGRIAALLSHGDVDQRAETRVR